MKDKQILDSVKRSMNQAPIDILDNIKSTPRTRMLRHDEITKQQSGPYNYRRYLPYASLAAAFVLVFLGWLLGTRMPDSRIYLDVNPSIQMTTNRQDKVIGLVAENGDGQGLTRDLDYKGMTVYEVTEEILTRMMDERYLDKDHEFLLLSVYNQDQDKAERQKRELDTRIHQYLQAKDLQPVVLSQKLENTSTIESYAREYSISVSKMTFIRNLIILNPELQVEDLAGLSIEDLVRLSQGMNLDLERIIDSNDFDRIREEVPQPQPETPPKPVGYDDDDDDDDDTPQPTIQSMISPDQARSIALSVANGVITDFDFDDDDMEYEVEIELGDLEYEITIDARTGAVIEVEIDD